MPRRRWIETYLGPPPRSPFAIPDGDLWTGGNRGAARQARQCGRQDNRVEEFGAASLPAANQASRFADCRRLNTRRVRRALSAVFGGAVSKDTVSRVWRKVKGDWDAWNACSLAEEPIIRL